MFLSRVLESLKRRMGMKLLNRSPLRPRFPFSVLIPLSVSAIQNNREFTVQNNLVIGIIDLDAFGL